MASRWDAGHAALTAKEEMHLGEGGQPTDRSGKATPGGEAALQADRTKEPAHGLQRRAVQEMGWQRRSFHEQAGEKRWL